MLPKGTTILEFCKSCDDKIATGTVAAEAASVRVPGQTDDSYFTKVNGVERDLAYVFVLGGKSKKEWVNLGLAVKCSTDPGDFDTRSSRRKSFRSFRSLRKGSNNKTLKPVATA